MSPRRPHPVTAAKAKAKRAPRHVEEANQRAFFSRAQRVWIPEAPDVEPGATLADYAYHPPMGGKRSAFEAHNLRRQGAKAGVSDIHIPLARCGGTGLWLEMKAIYRSKPREGEKRGRLVVTSPTAEQKAWLRRMCRAGAWTAIAWDWEDATALCKAYLRDDRHEMVGLDREAGANLSIAEPGDSEAWP